VLHVGAEVYQVVDRGGYEAVVPHYLRQYGYVVVELVGVGHVIRSNVVFMGCRVSARHDAGEARARGYA